MLCEVQGVHDEFESKGVERSMILLWDDVDKAEFNELIFTVRLIVGSKKTVRNSYTNYILCGEYYCKGTIPTPIRLLLKLISSLIQNDYFDFVTDVLIFKFIKLKCYQIRFTIIHCEVLIYYTSKYCIRYNIMLKYVQLIFNIK